ncbi:MAG TPA: helix-hairpin-helix domain-containing protein [Pedobacter sp.]
MRKWLNIYFGFSKREYNGLLVLIILLAVITAIPSVYRIIVPEQDDLAAESAAIKKLSVVEAEIKRSGYNKYRGTVNPVLFKFDPNHTSLSGWQSLGLSARQAAVMIRYVIKGGRFRKKEDLQKMYMVSPEMYKKWASYIQIDPGDTAVFTSKFKHPVFPVRHETVIVSLNTADTLALDAVKGIGPAFARRIVKYRERLGGFYKKEQLLEVFGLDSLKYREIKDQLSVDGTSLKLIHINTAVFEDLQHNPYLSFKQINAVIQFRKQHGNYSNIADLKKVAILPAETIEKLAPYISFDHD